MTKRPIDALPRTLLQGALSGLANQTTITAPAPAASRWEKRALLLLLVLAAVLRLWGVGSFGLHKPDEATTAIPAVHILVDGTPRFPSGMLYTRALFQSYLIAGSVAVFGQSEWAIRLPSVLCGVLLVWLGWQMSRRFLKPAWSIAFAAVLCFLPGMIADSQEARMYGFMVASLAAYAILVFQWERSERSYYLLAAVAMMMVAIHFHQLAIFGSLIVLFPALARGDYTKLRWAVLAMVPMAAYFVYIRWTPSPYPLVMTDVVAEAASSISAGKPPGGYGLRFQPLISAAALLAAIALATLYIRSMAGGWAQKLVGLLVLAGYFAIAGLYYHLAVLLLLTAAIVGRRHGAPWRLPLAMALSVTVLAIGQLWMLHGAGPGSLRKMLGVLVGQPSIWQYLIIGSYSQVAGIVVAGGLVLALFKLARGERIADYWLFFLLAVWAPLFLLGLTDWYFPARYTEFALLPLLITALAVCQQLLKPRGAWTAAAATVAAAAMINPLATARAVNAGQQFADHKGEALFMRAQPLGPRDIVIAEDVLYQVYYLGRVDYWLVGRTAAALYIQRLDGRIVEQYTHRPLISSAGELQTLIDQSDRGAIYIIGSGEDQPDGRRLLRGAELDELLRSGRFPTIFMARDGRGRIWKIDAPATGVR